MTTTLPSILEEALEFKEMKLGLERMRRFDAALGYPSRAFRSILVAGTNGKGSVATKIASALPGRVGLYTSPHIETYRERIQINREMISIEIGERLLQQIADQLDEQPTYFEFLTLLAFTHFAQERVDWAVLEVGMGGRLDATNIVTPELAVITSIGLDHTQYLGDTLEAIAREKGGVIRPGKPVVVGPHACYYTGAIEVKGDFTDFEEENSAIAKEALKVLGIEAAALTAQPPCRFQRIGNVILDVAHNPAALRRLFEKLKLHFPEKKVRAFVAFSSEKDHRSCLEVIEQSVQAYHLIKIDHPRVHNLDSALSFEEAFLYAQEDELIVICGTFFMMADARARLERGLGSG